MTANWYLDDPDEQPEHDFDGPCEICDRVDPSGFDDPENDFVDVDELDTESLRIDFAFDSSERRLVCLSTVGLWRLGVPELYLRPPRRVGVSIATGDAPLAVFLATGLIHLSHELLTANGFDVPPYRARYNGRSVRFWLAGQEPPFEPLSLVLGPEVDTVIQVACSLWDTPFSSRPGARPMIN